MCFKCTMSRIQKCWVKKKMCSINLTKLYVHCYRSKPVWIRNEIILLLEIIHFSDDQGLLYYCSFVGYLLCVGAFSGERWCLFDALCRQSYALSYSCRLLSWIQGLCSYSIRYHLFMVGKINVLYLHNT